MNLLLRNIASAASSLLGAAARYSRSSALAPLIVAVGKLLQAQVVVLLVFFSAGTVPFRVSRPGFQRPAWGRRKAFSAWELRPGVWHLQLLAVRFLFFEPRMHFAYYLLEFQKLVFEFESLFLRSEIFSSFFTSAFSWSISFCIFLRLV